MTRTVLAAFAALALAPAALGQGKYDPPPPFPPDDATMKQIAAKTAELRAAVAALPKETKPDVRADVEVYLKAAEWIVRHNEFYTKDSGKQTLTVLDAGLARAKAAKDGKAPWRDVRGKPVVRGFISEIDKSVQPYCVTVPEGFGAQGTKWRIDTVLHGRDQTLTEVKFIFARETAKQPGKSTEYVVLEPYGRGNNAYRWAGETDVIEARGSFLAPYTLKLDFAKGRRVLRGFSMGGAGTWHLGLHHPFQYDVIGPGAGFTTTHGYIKNLASPLPDYQEKCLRIYDSVAYAENAYNVPVVAYSGANDPQKTAADNIENALKGFPLPLKFTHLIAPGLEHRMPPEWQAKAEAEYVKAIDSGRAEPDHVRFVTYTTRYADFGHGSIEGLDEHYRKAVVDSRRTRDTCVISTTNIRALTLFPRRHRAIQIDGQRLTVPARMLEIAYLRKVKGKWGFAPEDRSSEPVTKRGGLEPIQGPIDDAFMTSYTVVPPTRDAWHPGTGNHLQSSLTRFGAEWDKFFRGRMPTATSGHPPDAGSAGNLVLFGDPQSNPLIASLIAKLPITWTKDKLVVNGVEYDPKTHVPVLIYPNPLNSAYYVVINSGHTFRAADLKGTNALLYPRLGDWAVLKVTPTEKDPAAAEVVAAGLFDEFWQFPKK